MGILIRNQSGIDLKGAFRPLGQLFLRQKGAGKADQIDRALSHFIETNGGWERRGFNHPFVELHVKPLITIYQAYNRFPSGLDIALTWDEYFGSGPINARRRLVQALAHDLKECVSQLSRLDDR